MILTISGQCPLTTAQIVARSDCAHIAHAELVLNDCILRSVEVRYGYVDRELACVWGLIRPTLLSTAAWMWLVVTDKVTEHKFLFVRYSQRWVELMLETYPVLVGDCLVDNRSAKRWLAWLGAEFSKPTHGKISFIIRAKHG